MNAFSDNPGVIQDWPSLAAASTDNTVHGEVLIQNVFVPQGKIMIITASAVAEASGDFRSYLVVEILVNLGLMAANQSYMPVDWIIGHFVSTSCIVSHNPTPYTLLIRARGEGIKQIRYQIAIVSE